MKALLSALLLLLACSPGVAATSAANQDEPPAEIGRGRIEAARVHAAAEDPVLGEQGLHERRSGRPNDDLEAERGRHRSLQRSFDENAARIEALEGQLEGRLGDLDELFGVARQMAGEAAAAFRGSLVSTQYPGRTERLEDFAQGNEVPTIAELSDLWLALQRELTESGRVAAYRTGVVGPDGSERQTSVTRIGVFTAVAAGAFLHQLPETGRLAELPRQPAPRLRRLARELEQAATGFSPMVVDPSRGSILSRLAQVPSLLERIEQGRLVGYLILGLALVGALVALERFIDLSVVGWRMGRQLRADKPCPHNPLGRILSLYREHEDLDPETLERMIEEVIVKDASRLQRGLAVLKVLTVIAPLLGLLGTVTGLIETFQTITLFGAGDARLMAGGISQALVTTLLGLTVAIPLILIHSGLLAKSRRLVAILEEQSVGLVARRAERSRRHALRA